MAACVFQQLPSLALPPWRMLPPWRILQLPGPDRPHTRPERLGTLVGPLGTLMSPWLAG